MDQRWQALHSHLFAARAAFESGDRQRALVEVTAALSIDAQFLAAQALRDQILDAPQSSPSAVGPPAAAVPVAPTEARPVVSADGYARFEARAKRRRVDRRVEAARLALERGRLKEAASAIDEIAELDRNLPELAELTAAYESLRLRTSKVHRGPWFAAAAVFVALVLGASWLQDSGALLSHPMAGIVSLVAPVAATTMLVSPDLTADSVDKDENPVATSGDRDTVHEAAEVRDVRLPVDDDEPPAVALAAADTPVPAVTPVPTPAAAPPPLAPPSPATVPPPSPPARVAASIPSMPSISPGGAAAPATILAAAPASAVPPNPIPPVAPAIDDETLIQQALQRYRTAYEGLDARSAQAVYPAINQAALARAFDGLQSQTLTFENCDVQMRGEAADATCRGTARYVPKIGSREPRTEPRVWTFTLRKAGSDWKIDTARAER